MENGKLKWSPQLQARLDALIQAEVTATLQQQSTTGETPDWNLAVTRAGSRFLAEVGSKGESPPADMCTPVPESKAPPRSKMPEPRARAERVHWGFRPRAYWGITFGKPDKHKGET